jgi:prolyl-tRNA editing enzyme YbaK/EbsC (Cys-tRNA(Pro) deacylase)
MSSPETTAMPRPPADRLRGFAAVRRSLDERGVDYQIVRHESRSSALADARAFGAQPRRVVKTVAVRTDVRLVTVALPASDRLHMRRVRHLLRDPGAQIAAEAELAAELPDLELGALPPFGAPAPPLVLVDRRVLASNWVLVNGGDHRHSLRVSPLEIVRLSQARVADIAES